MAAQDGWPSARFGGCAEPGLQACSPAAYALASTSAGLGSIRGHIGGTPARSGECLVQRIPGAATGLRDQVPVQVHGRGDGLVAEPAGHLGDRHTLSQGGTGERLPEVIPAGSVQIAYEGIVAETEAVEEISNWSPDREYVICRIHFDPPRARNLHVEGPVKIVPGFRTSAFAGEPEHAVSIQGLRKSCDHVRLVVEMFRDV